LYGLKPIRHSSVGAAVGLSATQAAANSLVRQLNAGLPPLVVVARGVTSRPNATIQPVML
jgi:hypothetical protein